MRVRGLILSAVGALAAASLLAQGQSAPPQFRAGVELITVDVAVLDGDRQPVRGLTEADFTVRENGVVRPIRAFTSVDLGTRSRAAEAVWSATVPPDVVTNQSGEEEGRLLIVLMDRSIPVEQPSEVARRIATAAIEALGPTDLAAVVTTGNGAIQNLTSDRTRLLRAINYREVSAGLSPEQEAVVAGFVTLDPTRRWPLSVRPVRARDHRARRRCRAARAAPPQGAAFCRQQHPVAVGTAHRRGG